jgi:hypothetical protein
MNEAPPKPRSNRTLMVVIIILLLVIICGGAVPVVGILAAIAIPNFVEMQLRAKRAEVPSNVDGIKTAQIAYDAAFDRFLAIPEPVPLDPVMIGTMAVDWPSGTPFDELGWEPFGQVRGTYWVEVDADGTDFTVHGLCDVDGDGEPAHYIATRTTSATLQTGSWVY